MTMNQREYFIQTLRATGRNGIDSVITNLEGLGFFNAPASTAFHLNVPAGLLQHSVNVYTEAMAIREKQIELRHGIESKLLVDSVAITALLHDVCKADIYKPAVKKQKVNGVWIDVPGYDADYSNFPLGHGEKSVIMLLKWGLEMTDDEIMAIRWHMNAWDLPFQSPESRNNFNAAKMRCPLLALIMSADSLASNILESK